MAINVRLTICPGSRKPIHVPPTRLRTILRLLTLVAAVTASGGSFVVGYTVGYHEGWIDAWIRFSNSPDASQIPRNPLQINKSGR